MLKSDFKWAGGKEIFNFGGPIDILIFGGSGGKNVTCISQAAAVLEWDCSHFRIPCA